MRLLACLVVLTSACGPAAKDPDAELTLYETRAFEVLYLAPPWELESRGRDELELYIVSNAERVGGDPTPHKYIFRADTVGGDAMRRAEQDATAARRNDHEVRIEPREVETLDGVVGAEVMWFELDDSRYHRNVYLPSRDQLVRLRIDSTADLDDLEIDAMIEDVRVAPFEDADEG